MAISLYLSLCLCLFFGLHPCLTWSTFSNYLIHNIQATWLSKEWCKPPYGAYVCVHVCVFIYNSLVCICFVPGSLAAGYISCMGGGGLSYMCVVPSLVEFVWRAHWAENAVWGLHRKACWVMNPVRSDRSKCQTQQLKIHIFVYHLVKM